MGQRTQAKCLDFGWKFNADQGGRRSRLSVSAPCGAEQAQDGQCRQSDIECRSAAAAGVTQQVTESDIEFRFFEPSFEDA
jgi:hypothetical protein